MFAALTASLFAAIGVFALAAMILSWLRFAPSVRALRDELAICEAGRELRVVVVTMLAECERTETRRPGLRPLTTSRLGQPALHYPAHRPALRAAA